MSGVPKKISSEVLFKVREKIIHPLKDAVVLSAYTENQLRANKGFKFKIKGRLRHEMYLKVIHPPRINAVIGRDFKWTLSITPDKEYNPDAEDKEKVRTFIFSFFEKTKVKRNPSK